MPISPLLQGLRFMIPILQVAKFSPGDSVLVSLDVEKAFDRVNWCYLSTVFSNFEFQVSIFRVIMSLYTSPSASVFTSGFLSSPFTISNGTRQGCPLSPLVFALCVEPLAAYIRTSPDISGITVGSLEHKIGLYANNIILICTSPEKSLSALLQILEEYSSIFYYIYYKLNKSKSSILEPELAKKNL